MSGMRIWVFSSSVDTTRDVVGYDVQATDGHVGKVDSATNDIDRSHLVVDTGAWIFEKRRLIPAGAVSSVDHGDRVVELSLTKDQIKDAPDHDESIVMSDDYVGLVDRYYGSIDW